MDRRVIEFYRDTLDCGYADDSPAATGSTTGGQVGDRRWNLIVTAIEELNETIPTAYKLSQNYPNPFNPTTQINFQIPKADKVTLEIFNVIGQRVATLINSARKSGCAIWASSMTR